MFLQRHTIATLTSSTSRYCYLSVPVPVRLVAVQVKCCLVFSCNVCPVVRFRIRQDRVHDSNTEHVGSSGMTWALEVLASNLGWGTGCPDGCFVLKAQRGVEVFYCLFNFFPQWGCVVNPTPRPLYSREWSAKHCIGSCMGHRTCLEGFGKFRLPPGFDPRNVQPVASRDASH